MEVAVVKMINDKDGFREGCKKSKWKFLMAFAIRGGGLEGVSFAIKLF